MKTLIPMVLLGFMLAGCPDAKTPKAPPGVPEPKASMADAAVSLAWAKVPDTPCADTA